MTGTDLISLLSVLIEVIIAAGAVFIAVKKKKTYGWTVAATFALYVIFDLLRMDMIPFIAGIDAFCVPCCNYRDAHRCVADD